jgi:hypothetical protein
MIRLGFLAACILALAAPVDAAEPVNSSITYVSGSSVYLDAGRDKGLKVGDVLDVSRSGSVIAQVRVQYIMSNGASCRVLSASAPIAQGDQVRFAPHDEPDSFLTPASPSPPTTPRVRSRGWLRDRGLRGRLGLRLLVSRSATTSTRNLSQPGFDFVVNGQQVGGTPMDLAVDARARRTYRSSGSESRTRVYRLSGAWHPRDSGLRITAGRQLSTSFSPVGVFDGGSAEIANGHWGGGVFGGTQPDPVSGNVSSKVLEYGLCVSREDGRGGSRQHSIQLGWIGSYVGGANDREYLFLQQRYEDRAFGTSLIMETDVNRGWRAGVGEPGLAVTSTYAQVHVRPIRALDLRTGLDNRRNVRLWRDRTTPETEFDDSYRQRSWVGAGLRIGTHVNIDTDVRLSGPGMSGNDRSEGFTFGVARISHMDLGMRLRSTWFRSDVADGTLRSLAFSISPLNFVSIDFEGGMRTERALSPAAVGRDVTWLGVDLDLNFDRNWYLMLSEDRTDEAGRVEDLLYMKLSLRN